MAIDSRKGDSESVAIKIKTTFVDAPTLERSPELMAYLFTSDAQLLDSALLDAKGEAVLRHPKAVRVANVRAVIGPCVAGKSADFPELLRRGALERHLRIDPTGGHQALDFRVFPEVLACWLRSACFVRGNLTKRVLVGGEHVNFPVCNATVEIYEVDPLAILIPKLSDEVLDRLRRLVLEERIPPLPHPGPGPEDGVFARAAMAQPVHRTQALDADVQTALRELRGADELRYSARIGSKLQFQQALIANPALIRPLLCWFWPRFVTMHRVATAHTDECGHFQTLFFQGCHNHDTPDLYFKAKQRLFGLFDVYIYAPTPIACYTYWNYACGSEVSLFTSSPWAQTCSPCPPVVGPPGHNRWVAFMAIGGIGLNHVHGASPDLPATTSASLGLSEGGRPWGGLLLPRLEFSPALEAAGVTYYRMSWREGTSGAFHPLGGEVHHFYRHDVSTPIGNFPQWSPHTLGPVTVDDGAGHSVTDMFKIPYASVAPAGVWDAPPDNSQIREHFASAKLPTQDIAPGMSYDAAGNTQGADASGKYQLALDLFDAQGQPVNIAALGILYVVPKGPDGGGAILTVDAATLGLVSGNRLIVTLHVDNNRCFASIDPPTIDGIAADPCCGVLEYEAGDNVTLAWRATHPHGFATYSFNVYRGAALVEGESGAASPGVAVSAQDYDVTDLLTPNPATGCTSSCSVAGFSENLYVDSLATNGWDYELGYDASAVRAFVLAKPATGG